MKIPKSLLSLSVVAAVLAVSACTNEGANQAGRSGEQASTSQGSESEQVLKKDYQVNEAGKLGSQATKEGEAEVTGKREIVTKRVENVREEIPTYVEGQKKADINQMKKEDFVALGLGERTAQSVVQYRDQIGGRFSSLDQLRSVPGIDTNWLQQNMSKLGVNTQAAGQAGDQSSGMSSDR